MRRGASSASWRRGAKCLHKEDEGPRLLLYDLWNDPYCLKSLHKERPDLAKKYTGILERKLREHQALAKKFPRGKAGAMDSEQLKTLQSLGYI